MTELAHALFDTVLGRCGVLWGPKGVCRLQLPEGSDDETRARLLRGRTAADGAPSPEVAAAIRGVQALFAGEAPDLSTIRLDMSGLGAFERDVYAALRQVPPGDTVTYGELARRVGKPGAAQAVGRAMARNPLAPVVPCHRVVAAGGRVGGFSAGEGVSTKVRLLEMERKADGGLFPDLPLAADPPRPRAREDAAGA